MATWFTTIVRLSMVPMEITFSSLYIASKHRTPAASRVIALRGQPSGLFHLATRGRGHGQDHHTLVGAVLDGSRSVFVIFDCSLVALEFVHVGCAASSFRRRSSCRNISIATIGVR